MTRVDMSPDRPIDNGVSAALDAGTDDMQQTPSHIKGGWGGIASCR